MSEPLENNNLNAVGETLPPASSEASSLIKTPHFGRAFDACINHDWAITEEGYRRVLTIASRLNDSKAVEAYRSQPLENTSRVSIRNGVAIIPITGPIFRYANLFTYYSGGTSVTQLGKDFRAALDNPNVFAILFELNSPGGEVTGINEFAKMVYAARTRKKPMPMTSRVGGLMCSAALWIGVMAGDVVIDETAQVGSIGVCTTYMDDSKWMALNGLEEINIISEQSPYKNMPPTSDEGLKRVRARLSALCQVFGEAVATGRDVKIKTVWDKFGQGDVFVGQAAIDAGLADRFGSFEETLDSLAKAHNPNYVPSSSYVDDAEEEEPVIDPNDDDEDDYADEKTLKDSPDAESGASQETSADSAELQSQETTSEEILQEEVMSEENKKNNGADADAANKSDAPVIDAAEFERLKSENARLTSEAEIAKANEAAAKNAQEKSARVTRMKVLAKEICGASATEADLKAEAETLSDLAEALGEDSDKFKAFVTRQKAKAAQAESAALFSEAGASNAATASGQSAEAKLDALAKERARKDGCNYITAYNLVLQDNPALYAQYEQETSR